MRLLYLFYFLCIFLSISCHNERVNRKKEVRLSEIQSSIKRNSYDSAITANTSSALKSSLKVSAYLKYKDGTLSTFDVLNDKSIALWNTDIGKGDALKPSNITILKLSGDLDSLSIRIENGSKLVIDTTIMHSDKDIKYTITETGCAEVYVKIVKSKTPIYNDTIPFHCGE